MKLLLHIALILTVNGDINSLIEDFSTKPNITNQKDDNNSDWKFEKEQNKIKIYTRKTSGWEIKEYKAEFLIKASLLEVKNALRDIPNVHKWSKNTIMMKEIKTISKDNFYTYSQTDFPFPAYDRDNIVYIKYSYPTLTSILITMKSVPDFLPEKNGITRIKKMNGSWHLEVLEDGITKVTQKAVVDPEGLFPSWLVNSFLIDGPLNNLKDFHDYVIEKNN